MIEKHKTININEATFTIPEEYVSKLEKQVGEMEIIGQPRAVQALQMGTDILGKGYNVFVTGATGTGRRSAINKILGELKGKKRTLRDIVYVYNFKEPDKPRVLYFPPCTANNLKKSIHQLVEDLKTVVKNRLESADYMNRKDELVGLIEQQGNHLLSEFEAKLSKEGFQIVHVQEGEGHAADIVPVFNGAPIPFNELHKRVAAGDITENDWNASREKYYQYMDEMKKIFSELRSARTTMKEELEALQEEAVRPSIKVEIDRLRKQYSEEGIRKYLDDLEDDLVENLYLFLVDMQLNDDIGNPRLIRYGVNIIEDCSLTESVPVIYENHPSYKNLFGNIDVRTESGGESRTNFMLIQAGSLIKASGGFIILNVDDLLQEKDSWYHLKRTLQTGRVEIQHQQGSHMWGGSLIKPEPIEIDVKVVLVGKEGMYDALYFQDPDFKKNFKLHAEFSHVMDRTEKGLVQYVGFIKKLVNDENLKKADAAGISAVIEYGVRLAGDKEKLSTRFSKIADLIHEADYWANKSGKKVTDREAVHDAVRQREYLSNRGEIELDDMIEKGGILVRVEGNEIGRVNGLAIYDKDYYAFARPSVISVRVAPGERGLINIEREAGLSGEIHDKGILIIEGFLRSAYACSFPLSVHASICFEQSYGQIDGDSASSTEIYALLSAISEVPLRQDIAVTGSVNQMGQIQPVGGITEKVEGFFRICKRIGLSGSQGVIIPKQNVRNLILSMEVCDAIEDGTFSIYPIEYINDGMEILTGLEAGKCMEGKRTEGVYPENSLNRLIETRLKEMAEQVRSFHHPSNSSSV